MFPDITVCRGPEMTDVLVDGVRVPAKGLVSVDCQIRPDSLTEVIFRYVTDSFSVTGRL